jgi:uncharacterized protein DUF3558
MLINRTVPKLAVAAVAAMLALTPACSSKSDNSSDNNAEPQQSTSPRKPKDQPFFPECGGVSDQTISQLTRVSGLVTTAKNSVGCQWLQSGGILGPHFSFTWYRGSPIGRERKIETLSRTSVEDIDIQGNKGFVAIQADPTTGSEILCEVGIQFGDDFFEWSISFDREPFPPACDVAKELARQTIAKMQK